ncbi:MAG TPA: hypothetical protein PK191_08100 [Niabella sp.]|nr:hypothetical protein [Niabella sp.]HOZ98023.1 hypothetical protein [Niabella sp.]HQW14832.1 hypothetical protein [Niabella sp.]HQX18543.1 hypothetical protein [Niabella sp.]HQX40763.1 hypothetical protein [Niabella sp.]
MRKSFFVSFSIITFSVVLLISCSKQESKDNSSALQGKWNLILWDNQVDTFGTFVFRDSVSYFNMNYSTEISTFKVNKDTIRFQRVGGYMTYLAGHEYWLIEKIDSAFFKLVSSDGNIASAYKQKYFVKEKPKKRDTTALSF